MGVGQRHYRTALEKLSKRLPAVVGDRLAYRIITYDAALHARHGENAGIDKGGGGRLGHPADIGRIAAGKLQCHLLHVVGEGNDIQLDPDARMSLVEALAMPPGGLGLVLPVDLLPGTPVPVISCSGSSLLTRALRRGSRP